MAANVECDVNRVRPLMVVSRNWEGTVVTRSPKEDVQLALDIDDVTAGELRLYKITLPYLPPSKNVYDNWMGQYKSSCKAKWVRDIGREVKAQQMPLGLQKIGLAAQLTFPSRARRDLSNYAQPVWNFVPDALVRAGVVVDDSEGHIDIPPNWGVRFDYDLRPGLDKKHRSRTVIAITMRVL